VERIHQLIEIFLHLDKTLTQWSKWAGGWTYALLFLIIFAETGLVVTPFLPGDSLLFGIGALAHTPDSPINLPLIAVLLCAAAVIGDAVNYSIGKRIGPAIFSRESSRFFNKAHLLKAHEFYEKYGGKTIIIARFVPIVRTFAPFVAGVAQMNYFKFALYNVVGGVCWVLIFLFAGFLFGSIPWVQKNFSIIAVAIVIISVMPMGVELLRIKLAKPKPEPVGSAK
jgi:membrane-associated protein